MDIYKGGRCDEWGTQPELLEKLGIKDAFDVCASAENAKFPEYWTVNDDALSREWPLGRVCFMNPPFSKAEAFFKKAAKEAARGVQVVSIYKATNLETKTWQGAILPHCDGVLFLKGRTEYVRPDEKGRGVPFGSAIIFYNVRKKMLTGSEHLGFFVNTHGGEVSRNP